MCLQSLKKKRPFVERYVHIFVINAFLATVLFVNFKNEHCILVACCITLHSFLFAEFEIDKKKKVILKLGPI
jgi:hypothetical protein